MVTTASFVANSSWPVVPCDHGWEYETSEVKSSIVIDVRFFFSFSSSPFFPPPPLIFVNLLARKGEED